MKSINHTKNKKWEAVIKINKQRYSLGSYKTEEEACCARSKVENEYKEYGILPHYINPKLTSKYKYVYWKEANKKWQIFLPPVNGFPRKYGGLFDTEQEAAQAVKTYSGINNLPTDIER